MPGPRISPPPSSNPAAAIPSRLWPPLQFAFDEGRLVESVEASIDGVPVEAYYSEDNDTCICYAPLELSDGAHILNVSATDTINLNGGGDLVFYVDTSCPFVTIDTPTWGQALVGTSVRFAGTFSGMKQ